MFLLFISLSHQVLSEQELQYWVYVQEGFVGHTLTSLSPPSCVNPGPVSMPTSLAGGPEEHG